MTSQRIFNISFNINKIAKNISCFVLVPGSPYFSDLQRQRQTVLSEYICKVCMYHFFVPPCRVISNNSVCQVICHLTICIRYYFEISDILGYCLTNRCTVFVLFTAGQYILCNLFQHLLIDSTLSFGKFQRLPFSRLVTCYSDNFRLYFCGRTLLSIA